MRNFLTRTFNFFLGINFTVGFFCTVWFLAGLIFNMPAMNEKNMFFLLVSGMIPWLTNFIFSYTSHLYIKGILHGVVWFVLEIILFNLMYGIALDASVLLGLAVGFAVTYALVLWLFSYLSAKLNMPVRHVAEFSAKFITMLHK